MKLVRDLYFPDSDIHMASEYEQDKTQLDTLNLALTFCTKTRTAVDAGAHVGIFSIQMAELFDSVIAFEPNPDTRPCTFENTKHLPNVRIEPFALSNQEREIGLLLDQRHAGNTGGAFVDFHGKNSYTTPLDSYHLDDLDLIKADVEGHELQAFQGAIETIKRCSPVIVCEEKARLMERQGNKPDSVQRFLGSLGYVRAAQNRRDFVYVKEK